MTLDDTDAVARRFGKVQPVDANYAEYTVNSHNRLKADFREGDELYHYDTTKGLAGEFGYLLVRGREIVGAYFTGMS